MTKAQTSRGDGGVKKSQLKKLVDNYYDVIKKKDANGKIVDLDRKKDAQSAWFSKAAIDQLFADHGCSAENNEDFGLRLYFAVHKKGVLHKDHEIPDNYHNQQTIVLVPTKRKGNIMDADLLKDDERFSAAADGKGDKVVDDGSGDGNGLNHTKLCPPDVDCGCSL